MKYLSFPALPVLLLVACAGSNVITYNLSMDVEDAEKRQILAQQSLNVMERRLEGMGEALTEKVASAEGDFATVTVGVKNAEALTALTDQMTRPFTLEIMSQADEGQKADIEVEGHGGFVKTGITGDDLEWIEGRKEPNKTTGEVKIVFTEEGRAKMATLFKQMKGKNIGLFVRDQLVSKLEVETDELKDDIVIRDIPTPELAIVFAEDVNVGTHVTFTPASSD